MDKIDITKKHKTRSGSEVIGLKYVPYNSAGNKVTYPIKGTIRELVNVRYRNRYCIWSKGGLKNVVFPQLHPEDDLIEVR